MKKELFGAILFLGSSAAAFAGEPHACAKMPDMNQVARCFEALPLAERITGFRDSIDALAPRIKVEEPFFSVPIGDQGEKLTRKDAVALYREIRESFRAAHEEARVQNKQLIFIGGESHPSRTCLLLGTMLLKIARRDGVERFGFETARESYNIVGKETTHYKGLLEQVGWLYDNLSRLPDENDPPEENFLGGPRHNQTFELWSLMRDTALVPRNELCTEANCWHTTEGKVGRNTYIFAADPMFWNWSKYPDIFGYITSREPGMASTLIEQSIMAKRGAPVVAIYGYMHFDGIAQELKRTERENTVLLRTLGFIQSLDAYAPSFRDDMDLANQRMKRLIDDNILRKGGNILMDKKGPETAAEALELADYADKIAGE